MLSWFFIVDKESNILWNMKVNACSRARIGELYQLEKKANKIVKDVNRVIAKINRSFLDFYNKYDRTKGYNLPDKAPTASTWKDIWLDDYCPWQRMNLTEFPRKPKMYDCIVFPTSVSRLGP